MSRKSLYDIGPGSSLPLWQVHLSQLFLAAGVLGTISDLRLKDWLRASKPKPYILGMNVGIWVQSYSWDCQVRVNGFKLEA